MKVFIYHVADLDFADTEPWGVGWMRAKQKATELKECIYRTVITEQREVYVSSGCFLSIDDAPDIKFFGEP